MAQVELIMPKMGESVAEATIIKWLKKEGDKIEADEAVLEIATDKVDSEVPSSAAGILAKQLYKEGDVIKVGAAIAIISTGGETTVPEKISSVAATAQVAITTTNTPALVAEKATTISENYSSGNRFYSPLVKNIAKKEGVLINELESIKGSGKDGRVTKNDILAYLPNRGKQTSLTATTARETTVASTTTQQTSAPISNGSSAPQTKVTVSVGSDDEIIEMDRMRKLIAEHMVMSKHVSPHVTSYVEVDVTNIVTWRDKVKKDFEKKEKEKITFTPIFIEAIVRGLKDFPMVNVSLDGTKIILRRHINIGMATALPSGNLIVPVIKDADHKNLLGLTKAVNDLAARARINKLQPDEIQGGTFTITNVGTFGNVMGTPIINQPQVAIMAVGAIRKKPAVIETPYGDTIGIRHMMYLSLSYDHRIVDGALGGSFLRRVGDYLEQFDPNRII